MNTLKVCHITSVHPWDDSRIFHKECVSLARAGYVVYLVAYDAPEGIVSGVHLIRAGHRPKNRVFRMLFSLYRFSQIIRKIDAQIIHFHDPELLPLGFILKRLRKTFIFDIHENISDQILLKSYLPRMLRRIVSKAYVLYEKLFLPYVHYCIAAVPYIRDEYKKRGYRVTEVQNFPIIEEFRNIEHNWNEKGKVICYAGLLDESRGGRIIIELMNRLPDWTLYIAGAVPDKHLLGKLQKHPCIQYLGFLPRRDLPYIFSKSIAGLVLFEPVKKYEVSLPIKMFEYMAAGLPVIATHFDYWQQFLYPDGSRKAGFLVDVHNFDEIVSALEFLWNNRYEAMLMGLAGRSAVMHSFHWKAEEKKLLEAYTQIITMV